MCLYVCEGERELERDRESKCKHQYYYCLQCLSMMICHFSPLLSLSSPLSLLSLSSPELSVVRDTNVLSMYELIMRIISPCLFSSPSPFPFLYVLCGLLGGMYFLGLFHPNPQPPVCMSVLVLSLTHLGNGSCLLDR